MYIGKGLTEAKAVAWLKNGKSTYSIVRSNAKKVASKLAKRAPINEIGRSNGKTIKGQYYLCQSSTRKPTGYHAFYGSAVKKNKKLDKMIQLLIFILFNICYLTISNSLCSE